MERASKNLKIPTGEIEVEIDKCTVLSEANQTPLIIADKSDVRRTRVRCEDTVPNDIHDRVNYAVISSKLNVDKDNKMICLTLKIDTAICPVMEYFEIFLGRMILCRKAADSLGLKFNLIINEQQFL